MVKDHLDSERGNPLPPHGLSKKKKLKKEKKKVHKIPLKLNMVVVQVFFNDTLNTFYLLVMRLWTQ